MGKDNGGAGFIGNSILGGVDFLRENLGHPSNLGQKAEEFTYVNGNIEGKYESFYENGQRYGECNYVNGEIIGEMKFYQWSKE